MSKAFSKYFPLMLTIISSGIYLLSLNVPFVYDDALYVVNNPVIQHMRWEKLPLLLYQRFNAWEYLPLRDLTYVIDYWIWGLNPLGYHITNNLIYVLTANVIYFFSRDLLRMATSFEGVIDHVQAEERIKFIAFLASILFIVHPVHVESVTWISGRKDLLCGLFYCVSCHCILKSFQDLSFLKKIIFYLLGALCFYGSVTSKALGITLPAVIFFMVILVVRRSGKGLIQTSWKTRSVKALAALVPLVILALPIFMIILNVGSETGISLSG